MESIVSYLCLILTVPLFFVLPGHAVMKVSGIRVRGLGGWTLCVGLSLAVLPPVIYVGGLLNGFTKVSVVLSIVLFSCLVYILHIAVRKRGLVPVTIPTVFESTAARRLSIFLVIVIALVAFSTDFYLKLPSGKVLGPVLGDNDKHNAMVTAMLVSETFPPVSPFAYPGMDIPLYYYFYFYLPVAAFYLLNSALISMMNTLSLFFGAVAGLFALCSAMLAGALFERRRAPVFAVAGMFASGLQVTWLAVEKYVGNNLIPWPVYLDDWSKNVVMMMPHIISWVPQHFFAAFVFLLAVLVLHFVPRKTVAVPLAAFLTACIMGSSIYSIVCVLLGLALLAVLRICRVFGRFSREELAGWCGYLILTGVFALPFWLALKGAQAGSPGSFRDVVALVMMSPLKSPIFGVVRDGTGPLRRVFWTVIFYVERLGPFLLIGLPDVVIYWKRAKRHFAFQVLVAVCVVALVTGMLMMLPGSQNEYGKYSSMYLVVCAGIFFAGGASYLFGTQWQRLREMRRRAVSGALTVSRPRKVARAAVFYVLAASLVLGLGSGLWNYHWAVVMMKIRHSSWPPHDDYLECYSFIHENIPRGAVIHAQRALDMVDYGERRVLISRAWPFPAVKPEADRIAGRIYEQAGVFFDSTKSYQGESGFGGESHAFLQEYGTDYIVIMDDWCDFFDKREEYISSEHYRLVYEDSRSAVYELKPGEQ